MSVQAFEIHSTWATAYKRAMRLDPCCYCGAPVEHLDHIIPRSRRGDDDWSNLTGACALCNTLKRETSLLGFLLWLDDRATRLLAERLRLRIASYRAVGT